MSNTPKGAMGSPYCSNEDGPSVADLMGDAFDRLHENSWDGGKTAQEKRIAKANKKIDEKLAEKKMLSELDPETTGIKVDEVVEEEGEKLVEDEVIAETTVVEKTKSEVEPKEEKKEKKEKAEKTTEPVVEELIIESIKENKKFTPKLKKEMIKLVMENSLELGTVTDEKITFKKNDKEFVILPV